MSLCYYHAPRNWKCLTIFPSICTLFMCPRNNLPVLSQERPPTPSPVRSNDHSETGQGRDIEVKACTSPARFLNAQRQFYQGDPNYVPPVTLLDRWRLTPFTSAFLKENQVALFLAYRKGEVVGRISATRHAAHDQTHGDHVGFFGHFEARDQATTHQLLDHACRWLREHGAETMRGPVDLSTNHRCGVLVEGEEEPPFPFMPYNPLHYRAYFESYGLQPVKRLLTIRLHGDPLLLGRAGSDLLGHTIGKALPPDVIRSSCFRRQIHPSSVGRPGCKRATGVGRTDLPACELRTHRNEPARKPLATIHFHHQGPVTVRGRI